MKNLEWTFEDKTEWGPGAWQSEPDKMQWTDEATGMPCLIVRNGMGALCGYVGLSAEHLLYGKSYQDVESDIEVHGGLTFGDYCTEQEHGICHIVEPGEPDKAFWLGFDCSHSGDYTPTDYRYRNRHGFTHPNGVYRDIGYVKAQCAALALQLRDYVPTVTQ